MKTDDDAPERTGKISPWNTSNKKVAKAALAKGVKAPSAPPQVLAPPPRETRQSREAKADKTVITLSSANPPTTPMAGFGSGAPKGKVTAKTKVVVQPAPKTKKRAVAMSKKKK